MKGLHSSGFHDCDTWPVSQGLLGVSGSIIRTFGLALPSCLEVLLSAGEERGSTQPVVVWLFCSSTGLTSAFLYLSHVLPVTEGVEARVRSIRDVRGHGTDKLLAQQPQCAQPQWEPWRSANTKSACHANSALTTGEEYRLLAGGADDARGVGSALGCAVYVDFCL